MIWYFTPYSLNSKLFDAYDQYASLVRNENDWICFLDGDSCFLTPDWGHVLEEHIQKYPKMGLFTSYVSRAGYPSAVPKIGNAKNPDIGFHRNVALTLLRKHRTNLNLKPYNRNVSGHLMLIKKSTWSHIREDIKGRVKRKGKNILGVDTMISHSLLDHGYKISLMRSVYCLHYFRYLEKGNKTHLLRPGDRDYVQKS